MTEDVNKLLGRGDYVDHWVREARHHGKGQRWQRHLMEVVAILEVAFGKDWLREVAQQPNRAVLTGDDPSRHPLGSWIATPSATNVTSVVELAVYLRHCARVPRLDDVLSMLRNPEQFSRAFVQLAFGYRFLRLGVDGLEFEPQTDGGRRADHFFSSGGIPYLVECYEPQRERHSAYSDLINHSFSAALNAADYHHRRVIAKVTLDSAEKLDGSTRKSIERDVRELIARLTDGGVERSVGNGYALEVTDTANLTAAATEEKAWSLAGPGDWLVNKKLVPRAEVAGISRGQPTTDVRLSWAIATVKQKGDPIQELATLAEKVSRKVSQVRNRAVGAKGIILVKSWIGRSGALGKEEVMPILEEIRAKVLVARSDLAGVFLVERGHDEGSRPFFGGAWLEGRDGTPLREFFERLRRRESESRVLDDWE